MSRNIIEQLRTLANIYAPGSNAFSKGELGFTLALPADDAVAKEAILRRLETIGFNEKNSDGVQIGYAASEPGSGNIRLLLDRKMSFFRHLEENALPHAIAAAQREKGIDNTSQQGAARAATSHVESVFAGSGHGDSRGAAI